MQKWILVAARRRLLAHATMKSNSLQRPYFTWADRLCYNIDLREACSERKTPTHL